MENLKSNTDLIIRPVSMYDIEDIVEILQERACNILVIMTDYEDCESTDSIKNYIMQQTTNYAGLRVRTLKSKKMFICYSEHFE